MSNLLRVIAIAVKARASEYRNGVFWSGAQRDNGMMLKQAGGDGFSKIDPRPIRKATEARLKQEG
jgi:hypothetical protein